jgi:hypothetical protein
LQTALDLLTTAAATPVNAGEGAAARAASDHDKEVGFSIYLGSSSTSELVIYMY